MQAPDNPSHLDKHSLTLIGRVTSPSVQKVWSLIPFFIDHWRTEKPILGVDFGQGIFKFQFDSETDLLAVLEKRPYHYARWMIILQRWELTLFPNFRSLIPFRIKDRSPPLVWRDYQEHWRGYRVCGSVEITNLAPRMRVHVNGEASPNYIFSYWVL